MAESVDAQRHCDSADSSAMERALTPFQLYQLCSSYEQLLEHRKLPAVKKLIGAIRTLKYRSLQPRFTGQPLRSLEDAFQSHKRLNCTPDNAHSPAAQHSHDDAPALDEPRVDAPQQHSTPLPPSPSQSSDQPLASLPSSSVPSSSPAVSFSQCSTPSPPLGALSAPSHPLSPPLLPSLARPAGQLDDLLDVQTRIAALERLVHDSLHSPTRKRRATQRDDSSLDTEMRDETDVKLVSDVHAPDLRSSSSNGDGALELQQQCDQLRLQCERLRRQSEQRASQLLEQAEEARQARADRDALLRELRAQRDSNAQLDIRVALLMAQLAEQTARNSSAAHNESQRRDPVEQQLHVARSDAAALRQQLQDMERELSGARDREALLVSEKVAMVLAVESAEAKARQMQAAAEYAEAKVQQMRSVAESA